MLEWLNQAVAVLAGFIYWYSVPIPRGADGLLDIFFHFYSDYLIQYIKDTNYATYASYLLPSEIAYAPPFSSSSSSSSPSSSTVSSHPPVSFSIPMKCRKRLRIVILSPSTSNPNARSRSLVFSSRIYYT